MEATGNLISKESIIVPKPEIQLENFDDLSEFLSSREALFENRLASFSLASKIRHGWQKINYEYGVLDKMRSTPEKGLFTGSGLCSVASQAIIDGIQDSSKSITLSAIQMLADLYAENWQMTSDITVHPHVVVKAVDQQGDIRYIDPTYAQIDHRIAGKIVLSTPEEFKKRYTINPIYPNQSIIDVTDSLKEVLQSALESKRFSQEKYQKLVQSLI
jgi:hypothetical protein